MLACKSSATRMRIVNDFTSRSDHGVIELSARRTTVKNVETFRHPGIRYVGALAIEADRVEPAWSQPQRHAQPPIRRVREIGNRIERNFQQAG